MFTNSTQTQEINETKTVAQDVFKIVLYNDDHNTFGHVIECMVKYCKMDTIQGEQIAWLVHHVGKAIVKEGDFSDLEPICTALCDNDLSASLEL